MEQFRNMFHVPIQSVSLGILYVLLWEACSFVIRQPVPLEVNLFWLYGFVKCKKILLSAICENKSRYFLCELLFLLKIKWILLKSVFIIIVILLILTLLLLLSFFFPSFLFLCPHSHRLFLLPPLKSESRKSLFCDLLWPCVILWKFPDSSLDIVRSWSRLS